jgi:hypothetical protein
MIKGVKAATAAALLAAGTIGAVAPAEAHGPGVAIGAGLLGLGIGAAIASDHPHYVQYAPPPTPPPRVYYAPPPPVVYYAPPRPHRVCSVRYDWWGYPHQRCWWPAPY